MRECPPCRGSGKAWGIYPKPCPRCDGDQILPDPEPGEIICNFCRGSGREEEIYEELCSHCEGRGYRRRKIATDAQTEGPSVFFLEAGRPRTGHLVLSELFSALKGLLRICDPYYGTGTLARLDGLVHCPIRFLSKNPDTKESKSGILLRLIKEFTVEHRTIEFRSHQGDDLHDRFILSDEELILLGHGLKDVGNKDSFIVRLDRTIAGNVIDDLRQAFDQKWSSATRMI